MTATPAMATPLPSHRLVGRSQTCTLAMQAMHLSLRCAAYIGMLSSFGIVAAMLNFWLSDLVLILSLGLWLCKRWNASRRSSLQHVVCLQSICITSMALCMPHALCAGLLCSHCIKFYVPTVLLLCYHYVPAVLLLCYRCFVTVLPLPVLPLPVLPLASVCYDDTDGLHAMLCALCWHALQ